MTRSNDHNRIWPDLSELPLRRDRPTNDTLRRVLGSVASVGLHYGVIVESTDGWRAEVYEVEQPRLASSADIFRCNWVDLRVGVERPLWSGMVRAGVPRGNHEAPMILVQDEDFSRRGFPSVYIVNGLRAGPTEMHTP